MSSMGEEQKGEHVKQSQMFMCIQITWRSCKKCRFQDRESLHPNNVKIVSAYAAGSDF